MNRSRTRTGLVVVLLAAGLGIIWPSVTSAAPQKAAAATPTTTGTIVFSDDFTGAAGSAPNASKWQDYSACSYNPSAAFGNITCGNNETLDGAGHLVVPATPTTGSAIRTGSLYSFQYGTMSAWIKMPAQAGYWPAFWSLNSPANGSSGLPTGEVDVMEGYTTWLNAYHATAHSYGADGSRYDAADNLCPAAQNLNLSAAYHKYSASIDSGKITFYFDDVQCGPVHTKAAGQPWGFGPDVTRGNWMILDLAIGGAGGQQQTPTANAQMLVDRVEVRALPSATTTAAPTPSPTPAPTPAPTVAPTPSPAPAATATPAPAATPSPTAAPAATPQPSPAAAVTSGATYRVVNACGNMVLEVPPSSATTSGAPLDTAVWTGGAGQRWRVVSTDTGYYKLVNIASGQVANVAYASMSAGAGVIQYTDDSGYNEQWAVTSSGSGQQQLTSRQSGMALDVTGGSAAAGAAVDQSTPVAGCAESWSFVPA